MNQATKEIMDLIKAIKYEYWPTEKLIAYARNPRKNDHVVDKMVSNIKEYGMPVPLCVRPDGTVVDGHLRLKAAKVLGLPELPVAINETWTPQQVKAFRISVNRSATWADWDNEFLKLELQELESDEFDLLSTGFDSAEINKILGSLDFTADSEEGGENSGGDFQDGGAGHVKMIQLFYDEENEKNFRALVNFIDARFNSGNISDTVYSALQYAASQLEKEGVSAAN